MLRIRALLFVALLFCLPLLLKAQSLPTGSSTYSLTLNGKLCGKISSNIASSADGYSLTTTAKLQIDNTPFNFSRNGMIDRQLHPVEEILNGSVDGSAVVFGVDASEGKYNIKVSANGKQSSNTLAPHPHTVFLPDFDPIAMQVLVTNIITNKDVWALIPKQTGLLYAIQITERPQEQGTLDGKPVAVRHVTATIAGVASEVFSTMNGLFVQQETPEQGFALVRDGFKLTPSATTKPANTPPPAS